MNAALRAGLIAGGAVRSAVVPVARWFGDFWAGVEGSWRGPFYGRGELGGWYELASREDGFQRNLGLPFFEGRHIPACYAAVMANARAVSQCYPSHRRLSKDGVHEVVTTSPASRILRKPNGYETWPQFILNVVASMQFDGECYALALRDDRGAVTSLHRMARGTVSPFLAPDDYVAANLTEGAVFYSVDGVPFSETYTGRFMAPARDVLHLRMHCPRHPLVGESSITAAAMAAGINVALSRSQLAFFSAMNRPSGILSTDQPLNAKQMTLLRRSFDEQSKVWNQGGLPILSNGLKFQAVAITSQDANLIQAQRLSIEDIARVFGVPLPVIGDLSKATLTNVEELVQLWLSISLGSLLENVERSFDALFGLDGVTEYVEFDTAALLRSAFRDRIEGLTRAIQGGLMTPNEARDREGLGRVPAGDTVYVQAQMIPLGSQPEEPKPDPAEADDETDDEATPPDDEADDDETKGIDPTVVADIVTAELARFIP